MRVDSLGNHFYFGDLQSNKMIKVVVRGRNEAQTVARPSYAKADSEKNNHDGIGGEGDLFKKHLSIFIPWFVLVSSLIPSKMKYTLIKQNIYPKMPCRVSHLILIVHTMNILYWLSPRKKVYIFLEILDAL